MKYAISGENAAVIKEYSKSVKEKYLDRRLHAFQILGEGVKLKDIAEKLDVGKRQISVWAKNFCEKGGIEGFEKSEEGEVEPLTGERFFLIMPYCNTICMNVFLEELSKAYPRDKIILACDGAAWHKLSALKIPENIEIFLSRPTRRRCILLSRSVRR